MRFWVMTTGPASSAWMSTSTLRVCRLNLSALGGIDPAEFTAKYLAIRRSTIEYRPRSSVEPLITLEPGSVRSSGCRLRKGAESRRNRRADADFTVTRLRAVFRSGDLTEFTCHGTQLKIIKLFGYNVKPVKPIDFSPAAGNAEQEAMPTVWR